MRRKEMNEERIREYIAEALLILLKKKSYQEITIGEIAEKAGVNRSSYYRHFETREDIIRYYLASLMKKAMTRYEEAPVHRDSQSGEDFPIYLRSVLETMYEHKEELLLLHRNGLSSNLLEELERYFGMQEKDVSDAGDQQTERAETLARQMECRTEEQYQLEYRIGGIYASLILWLRRDMQETPEELAKIALSWQTDRSLYRKMKK